MARRKKRDPNQDMGSLASISMVKNGIRPEDISIEQREEAVLSAIDDSDTSKRSFSHLSRIRASESKKAFISECANRGTLLTTSERVYSNLDELSATCKDYVAFCISHDVIMSTATLALWLGISKDTINLALSNGDVDERFIILKQLRDIMDAFLEQDLSTYEGNASGKIYLTKARFDWRETPQEVTISHKYQNSSVHPMSTTDAIDILESIPDDSDSD